jgi:hypothetical protein
MSLLPSLWIPTLNLSRAAALAVPRDQPYREAIREKLVGRLRSPAHRSARPGRVSKLAPTSTDRAKRKDASPIRLESLTSPSLKPHSLYNRLNAFVRGLWESSEDGHRSGVLIGPVAIDPL